jgi:hypothetical protein
MPKDYFGEHVAERYDETSAEMFEAAKVEPVVDFLVELATDGSALELGIGTGRIAHYPLRSAASASMALICPRRWFQCCGRSQGQSRSV